MHYPFRWFSRACPTRGFSLVELSVVVAILSVVSALGLEAAANFVSTTSTSVSRERLKIADDAVARFFRIYGRLPCPAVIGTAPSVNTYGLEDCTLAVLTATTKGGGVLSGAVPFRTLNLPMSNSLDGFNSKFNYVVTKNLTSAGKNNGQFGAAGSAKVLVVAGGGGGGGGTAGGGGGGGMVYNPTFSIPSGTITVTVGNGGTRSSGYSGTSTPVGGNGGNSAFGTITAVGGGGGGGNDYVNGAVGGSGGGGGWNANGAAGTVDQGNAGANGVSGSGGSTPNYGGGGGGGAGAAGTAGSTTVGGAGGNGAINNITGAAITYGGGGGGGTYSGGTLGAGGAGGGGGGTAAGTNGLGGGGGGASNNSGNGGNGGSGVVIVRYAGVPSDVSVSGSATSTTIGGDTIWTFTGSGTFSFNGDTTATKGVGGIEVRTGQLEQPCSTKCQIVADPAANPGTGAAYFIFSSGPDLRGATSPLGASLGACAYSGGSDKRVDTQNCVFGNNSVRSNMSVTTIPYNVFYDNRYNAGLNLSSYYDNVAIWRSKSQL